MRYYSLVCVLCFFFFFQAEDGIRDSSVTGVQTCALPISLTAYLPAAGVSNGTAVIICPGGGYAHLSMEKEGSNVAAWLNTLGVAAFVLKYRLGPKFHHPAQLDDAQAAIRMVRTRAASFGVSPNRIGIMGFSAGGHLAATAS